MQLNDRQYTITNDPIDSTAINAITIAPNYRGINYRYNIPFYYVSRENYRITLTLDITECNYSGYCVNRRISE